MAISPGSLKHPVTSNSLDDQLVTWKWKWHFFTHGTPEERSEAFQRCILDRIRIRQCWFLSRGETQSTRRKTSRSMERANNKLNPHVTPRPGIEPGPHWWEASGGKQGALTTAPPTFLKSRMLKCPNRYFC